MKAYYIFSFFILLFLVSAGNIFTLGRFASANTIETADNSQFTEKTDISQESQQSNIRAELIMKALAAAYPDRILKVEFRNDDWAILLRDRWFYYANGKILPEDLLDNAEDYSRLSFYNYPYDLPPWKKPSEEEAARYSNIANNRNNNPRKRSSHFFDDLYRMHDSDEASQRVKSIRFLGMSVVVHYSILEELSLVEERIQALAKTDSNVRLWVNNIKSVDGWVWRNIADIQSRSFHSYGTAIDIMPKSFGNKQTYWLWATEIRSDWWNISYSERYQPPDAVIKAFEAYGFIWGGKWLIFDTMHFEYRPDIIILNNLNLETMR